MSLKSVFKGIITDHVVLVNQPEGKPWRAGKRSTLHFNLTGKRNGSHRTSSIESGVRRTENGQSDF